MSLVSEKGSKGAVYFSIYPIMMGLIEIKTDGKRRFGIGRFDLVIIDEAHTTCGLRTAAPVCSQRARALAPMRLRAC